MPPDAHVHTSERMSVHVHDAWHDERTSQINDLGVVTGHGLDIGVRADREEPPILDRDGIDPGLGFVDRVDPPVGVNGVGNFAWLSTRP